MTAEVLKRLEKRIFFYLSDRRWRDQWGLTHEQLCSQRELAELHYYANMRKIELGIFKQTI